MVVHKTKPSHTKVMSFHEEQISRWRVSNSSLAFNNKHDIRSNQLIYSASKFLKNIIKKIMLIKEIILFWLKICVSFLLIIELSDYMYSQSYFELPTVNAYKDLLKSGAKTNNGTTNENWSKRTDLHTTGWEVKNVSTGWYLTSLNK